MSTRVVITLFILLFLMCMVTVMTILKETRRILRSSFEEKNVLPKFVTIEEMTPTPTIHPSITSLTPTLNPTNSPSRVFNDTISLFLNESNQNSPTRIFNNTFSLFLNGNSTDNMTMNL